VVLRVKFVDRISSFYSATWDDNPRQASVPSLFIYGSP
jgi:hypothetical protein